MINKLNNANGKGSNAVVNKQIKDLQNDVSQLQDSMSQVVTDLVAIDADLDNKVDKNELASEVDTTSVKATNLKVDTIESKDEESIQISDDVDIAGNISAGEASFTQVMVNGVDVVDDYTQKTACAISDASNAVCTANDALTCACNVQSALDTYKAAQALQSNTVEANIGCARVSCSVETPALTVSSCAEIRDLTSQTVRAKAELMDSFVEPTEKDDTDFYLFNLPPKFQGRVHLVAYDTNDDVAFSATIDTAFSDRVGTALGDREGTGILIHSGVTKWDFYQLLRRKDQDRLAFITQSNVKTLYYKYDNFDKTEEPTYEIYPNLTDEGPDYSLYDTIYTAEHSDQVVIYGNEDTLNGGLTVFGTFYATAFEVPETEVANVRVKENIYGGYDCDTGEFSTKGTRGGLITFSDCPGLPKETVTWVNGCPRTVVRKGVCECADGYGKECSQLCYEAVKTCDDVTGVFKPSMTDSLFDERGLATYEGETSNNTYPIKHLNCDTCVHGDIEIECDAKVCNKIITSCIESDTDKNLGITSKCCLSISSVSNIDVNVSGNFSNTVCGNSVTTINGNETKCNIGTVLEVHDDFVDKRYACGKSETISAGDYTLCAQGGNISVTACCDVGFTSDTHSISATDVSVCACCTNITGLTTIDCLTVNCHKGNFNVDGDIRASQIIANSDVTVHGDLYVDGNITATSETQVTSTGDFIVTRDNNGSALANNEYSGIAVNNYDGNGSIASITTDNSGEWRVSDSASSSSTIFTDISKFNSTWYEGLTRTTATTYPTGILSNFTAIELGETVYNGTGYYHKSGSDWYGPVTISGGSFDIGSLVIDPTEIAALDALTKYDLIYYSTVTSTIIVASSNQPILTRDEATNMSDGNVITWNATYRNAVTLAPTGKRQVLFSNASCLPSYGINSCIIPVYDSYSCASADLANIAEGEIIITLD